MTRQALHLSDSITDFFKADRYKKLFKRISRHELFSLAGSFAYTTSLALSPFIIITISVLTLLKMGDQQALSSEIQSLVGAQAGSAVESIIASAERQSQFSGIAGIFGLLILLISASAIFSQLRMAFDKIVEYKAPKSEGGLRSFLRQRIFSVGLVLGFIFLMIVSLAVTSLLATALPASEGIWLKILSMLVNLLVFSFLFACMFRFIPSERLPWPRCLISGVVASVFFLIGKFLIGLYLGKSTLAWLMARPAR